MILDGREGGRGDRRRRRGRGEPGLRPLALPAATRTSSTVRRSAQPSRTRACEPRRWRSAANLTLGPITQIVEGGGGAPQPYALDKATAESTPIEPGEQELVASVTVTFATP